MRLTILYILLFTGVATADGNSCQSLFTTETPSTFSRTYENSNRELINSIEVFSQSTVHKSQMLSKKLYEWQDNTLIVSEQLTPQQVQLVILHAVLQRAATSIGLSLPLAQELGFRIQKEACEALQISWTSHQQQLQTILGRSLPLLSKKQLLDALLQINQWTEVSQEYQIPYLAGYAKDNPQKVYIDSELPPTYKLASSELPLTNFLVVHERIEKALMDTTILKRDTYLATHQVAQRIEKLMLTESGYSWKEYQKQVMKKHIHQAADENRNLHKIPPDLDLTPYIDAKDILALEKMEQALINQPKIKEPFDLKIVAPGVVHLQFHNQVIMAWTMMRFQEFYESPKFRGKLFLRKEFLRWFAKRQGGFNSYTEWDGFNVPNVIFEAFFTNRLPDLTHNEQVLLNRMRHFRHAKFYIIATAGSEGVLRHELAHARFYFDESYKSQVLHLLQQYNIEPVLKFLREKASDYHEAVLLDEAHAWLMNDSNYMKNNGFDPSPYKELIYKLNDLFEN